MLWPRRLRKKLAWSRVPWRAISPWYSVGRSFATHRLLLAAGQLDPVGELVLGDRALLLDRLGAPRERRLVGLLLDRLAGGLLEGALHVAFRGQPGHPDRRDLDPQVGQR